MGGQELFGCVFACGLKTETCQFSRRFLPCSSFLEKGKENPPKKQEFFIPTEPQKSLEKKGKTLEKNKEILAGERSKEIKKSEERKDRAVSPQRRKGNIPLSEYTSSAVGPAQTGSAMGGVMQFKLRRANTRNLKIGDTHTCRTARFKIGHLSYGCKLAEGILG